MLFIKGEHINSGEHMIMYSEYFVLCKWTCIILLFIKSSHISCGEHMFMNSEHSVFKQWTLCMYYFVYEFGRKEVEEFSLWITRVYIPICILLLRNTKKKKHKKKSKLHSITPTMGDLAILTWTLDSKKSDTNFGWLLLKWHSGHQNGPNLPEKY